MIKTKLTTHGRVLTKNSFKVVIMELLPGENIPELVKSKFVDTLQQVNEEISPYYGKMGISISVLEYDIDGWVYKVKL